MARPVADLDQRALRPRLLDRIELCGYLHAVTMATPGTDEVIEPGTDEGQSHVAYRCRSLWCLECAALHRYRFKKRATELISSARRPVLLTLTHRNEHPISLVHEDGQQYSSTGAGKSIAALRAHWKRATALLRDAHSRYQRARTERGRQRALALVPTPAALKMGRSARRKYARTFKKGQWIGFDHERNWLSVVELTTGGRWYHAHFHVVCESRALAELLNAAWQATRSQDQFCRTQIDRRDIGQTPEQFADYVSKYVVKPHSWDADDATEMNDDRRRAVTRGVVRAMHRARRANGSGAWRDLHLARRAPDGVKTLLMWHPLGSTPTQIAEREGTGAQDGLPAHWHGDGWRRSFEALRASYRWRGMPATPSWRAPETVDQKPTPAHGPGGRAALAANEQGSAATTTPAPLAMAASAARILDCQERTKRGDSRAALDGATVDRQISLTLPPVNAWQPRPPPS